MDNIYTYIDQHFLSFETIFDSSKHQSPRFYLYFFVRKKEDNIICIQILKIFYNTNKKH